MADGKSSTGLNENIAGLLCYVLTWVTGIVFYLLEKDSDFVKFHAKQSIVTFLPLTILAFALGFIPFAGWIISMILSIVILILWLVLVIKAYQGEKWEVPVFGDLAERAFGA